MAGLLDYNPQEQFMTQGLLGMGSALLTPVARGGGFAAVGPALMSAQSNAMQMAEAQRLAKQREEEMGMRRAQFGLQQQEFQARLDEAARARKIEGQLGEAARQSFIPGQAQIDGTADPGKFDMSAFGQRALQIDPTGKGFAFYQASLKDNKPIAVKEGETLLDPTTFKPIFEGKKTASPTELQKLIDYRNSLPPGHPDRRIADMAIQKSSTHQPGTVVNNITSQESEQSKVYGRNLGEIRSGIAQAAFNAPAKLAQLSRMETLLRDVDGGKYAPAGKEVASALNSIGIKVDPNLGNKEAAEALSLEIAGSMRQPGTGTMTDKDFEGFLKRVPDLSKSAAGRRQIITTMRSALQRDIEVDRMARTYAKKNNGVIDDNFFDQVSQFYAQNPVVPQADTNPLRSTSVIRYDAQGNRIK